MNKPLLITGIIGLLLVIIVAALYINVEQSVLGSEQAQVRTATFSTLECKTCNFGLFNNDGLPVHDAGTDSIFALTTRESAFTCTADNSKNQGDFLKGCNLKVKIEGEGFSSSKAALQYQRCLGTQCFTETKPRDQIFLKNGETIKLRVVKNVDVDYYIVAEQFCLRYEQPTGQKAEIPGCGFEDLVGKLGESPKTTQGDIIPATIGIDSSITHIFYGYLTFGSPVDLVKHPISGKIVFLQKKVDGVYACPAEVDQNGIYVVDDNNCKRDSTFQCVPSLGNCNPYTAQIEKAQSGGQCQSGSSQQVVEAKSEGYYNCQLTCQNSQWVKGACNIITQPEPLPGTPCKSDERYDPVKKTCLPPPEQGEKQCKADGGVWVQKETKECGFLCSLGLSEQTTSTESFCKQPNYLLYIVLGFAAIIFVLLMVQLKVGEKK